MISRLELARVTLPEGHPRAGADTPVFGYVVHHPEGPILVDTGVVAEHPVLDRMYAPRHRPLVHELARVGVQPDEVRFVVNSHLHFDHCGNNRLFPGVPLAVQGAEHERVTTDAAELFEHVDFPGASWQIVDGELELCPGVRVLPTPGHTAGHQSVAVATPQGTVVIAAQALYDPDELTAESSAEPLEPEEAAATAASARRIKSLQPIAVVFSHDERTWRPPVE